MRNATTQSHLQSLLAQLLTAGVEECMITSAIYVEERKEERWVS